MSAQTIACRAAVAPAPARGLRRDVASWVRPLSVRGVRGGFGAFGLALGLGDADLCRGPLDRCGPAGCFFARTAGLGRGMGRAVGLWGVAVSTGSVDRVRLRCMRVLRS